MRYLRVAVHQDQSARHPMHQFVVEHEGYSVTRLLQMNFGPDGENAILFHVEGEPDRYEAALAEVDLISEYAISPCADDSFYLYVRDEMTSRGETFAAAFSRQGLVPLMPVEYRGDGTVRVTVVGPAERLQEAVEEVPAEMDVEVLEVGEYDARRLDAGSELTDRQFEAVAGAVDCGYYETPREGTVADVGERLDCAPGTAAELLRRAEKRVMHRIVTNGPF